MPMRCAFPACHATFGPLFTLPLSCTHARMGTHACMHAQALCDRLYTPGLSREEQRAAATAALDDLSAAEAAEAATKERQKRDAEAALKVGRGAGWGAALVFPPSKGCYLLPVVAGHGSGSGQGGLGVGR